SPLAVSDDGRLLLVGGLGVFSYGNSIRTNLDSFVLDAVTGEVRYSLHRQQAIAEGIHTLHFSADSRYILDFSQPESSLQILSAEKGTPLTEPLKGYPRSAQDLFNLSRVDHLFGEIVSVLWNPFDIDRMDFRIEGLSLSLKQEQTAILSWDGSKLAFRS